MEESRLRPLKLFLRVYAVLSLILFSVLMLGFATKFPLIDEGGAWHWLSWDRVTDHVAPMLFAIYIVWSIFTDKPWVLLPAAAITVLRPSRQTTDTPVDVTTAGLRSRS